MKLTSESKAIGLANKIKAEFAAEVRENYEHKAKDCSSCATPGACCLDAHFVNVHITRLEAAAIENVLARLPEAKRQDVYRRIDGAVTKFDLSSEGDTFQKKYACPLYENGTGCLVHCEGKPLPCIQHACYEEPGHLPPDRLMQERAASIELLNRRCYQEPPRWLPLPVYLNQNRER